MTIQASAQGHPIVTPNPGQPFTTASPGDTNGYLTNRAAIALQQSHDFIVSMNRIMPCNAAMALNVLTLTLLNSQPQVNEYVSYDEFAFVAPADASGDVSARIVTETGTLATLGVYKNNGFPVTAGEMLQNGLYRLIYNDALDGGNGGFTLDGNIVAVIIKMTDATSGAVSNTVNAVSGTGDDSTINDNFASITSKLNEIILAIGG